MNKPFRTYVYGLWALHKEEVEDWTGTPPNYDFRTYFFRNVKFLKDSYRERVRNR